MQDKVVDRSFNFVSTSCFSTVQQSSASKRQSVVLTSKQVSDKTVVIKNGCHHSHAEKKEAGSLPVEDSARMKVQEENRSKSFAVFALNKQLSHRKIKSSVQLTPYQRTAEKSVKILPRKVFINVKQSKRYHTKYKNDCKTNKFASEVYQSNRYIDKYSGKDPVTSSTDRKKIPSTCSSKVRSSVCTSMMTDCHKNHLLKEVYQLVCQNKKEYWKEDCELNSNDYSDLKSSPLSRSKYKPLFGNHHSERVWKSIVDET